MSEFFSPATTNARKAEIEALLTSFGQQASNPTRHFPGNILVKRKADYNFGGKFERVVSYQQRDAWRQCLDFAARTSNQYVAMFALNTLENVIRRQWVGIPGNEHAEIRSTLQNFLEVHFKSAPPYIRNKLMKLGCYSVLSLHSHDRL